MPLQGLTKTNGEGFRHEADLTVVGILGPMAIFDNSLCFYSRRKNQVNCDRVSIDQTKPNNAPLTRYYRLATIPVHSLLFPPSCLLKAFKR
jgi:hypothetical protein